MAKIKKMIVNPEWVEHRKQQRKENHSGYDYPYEDLYPEGRGKKLPDDGGWIIILLPVRVGTKIDEHTIKHIEVPHLSVWFAVPAMANNGELYQAAIHTPDGEVRIWPHEYQLFNLEKFLEFSDEDGFSIHFLSETGGFDEQAMFYIRSRGISKADAQRMLLPTLKDPNYCWFQFAPEFSDFFPPGTGMPYLMPSYR